MGTDEGKFANISQSCFVPSIDYKEGSNGAHIYIYNFPDCSEKCFKNILLALKYLVEIGRGTEQVCL